MKPSIKKLLSSESIITILETLAVDLEKKKPIKEFSAQEITDKAGYKWIPSYALDALDQAGLINSRISGRVRYISLTDNGLKFIKKYRELCKIVGK